MSEPPAPPADDELTLDEYLDDYRARFWNGDHAGGWKLERQQTFRELDNASWEASDAGDWPRAMALLDQKRDQTRSYQERIRANGLLFRRVRVVEKPYTPYLIWELNSLMIRHEYGERIHVLSADRIHDMEREHHLPEIVVLDSTVVYSVMYDHTGLAAGATRSTNRRLARAWLEFIRDLHERGEDLPSFFHREIAGLVPASAG